MVGPSTCPAAVQPIDGPVHHVATPFERITFGMGCFWGCDSLFGATKGVLRTRVGYAGGRTGKPSYKDIGDHIEVIELEFDPTVVTLSQLLDLFWANHNYGRSPRMKRQYSSLIMCHSDSQCAVARASMAAEQQRHPNVQMATELQQASIFYPAENYHQKYRLQSHKEFTAGLGLTSDLLLTSHVAAKLNGYLVGVGGLQQFEEEAPSLGLSASQQAYVKKYLLKNKGGNLMC